MAVLDFGIGALIGGLMLSACWGWFWLAISTVGFTRGICGPRVVVNSLIVGLTPLLFGASVWWMRAEAFSFHAAFVAGLLVMPSVVLMLGLRRASDGRRAGLHMAEGVRHLRSELLGTHHECEGCGHGNGADGAGGCA